MNYNNLREDTKNGDEMFPFICYHRTLIKGIEDLILHFHEEIEIILIENGEGYFKIGNEIYNAKKGDILIINKSTLHSGHAKALDECTCKTMVFNLNMLTNSMMDSCEVKYILPLIKESIRFIGYINQEYEGYDEIYKLIDDIFISFTNKKEAYEIKIKGLIFQVISNLFQYNHLKVVNYHSYTYSEKNKKIKSLVEYINTNYNQEIKIKDLCNLINYSEYHLIRFFKEQTGMTCVEYINNVRMSKASNLLLETDESITEIASKVGFNNASYFNKKFRAKYDETPIKY